MLTLRYARQSRCFVSPLLYSAITISTSTSTSAIPDSGSLSFFPLLSPSTSPPSSSSSPFPSPSSSDSDEALQSKNITLAFKQWFAARRNPLFDQIFEILGTQEGLVAFESLRCLNIYLTEKLVLDVLKYGKSLNDVFSCVRFFDWAGNQKGFCHSPATYHSMFQIFNKAKCSWVIHNFIENYTRAKCSMHLVRFYDTLVIGYSVVGKPEIALEVFGRMRFQGTDLNSLAYHVFLNSLVEEGFFDVVLIIVEQIRSRGLENEITHSIMMKNFCKKGDLNRAEEYLRCLMTASYANEGRKVGFGDTLVGILVDALCRAKQFEKADALVEEMETSGVVSKEYAYGSRVRHLIQTGKLDRALDFYKSKMENDGYSPGLRQYNSLVFILMKEYRLREVFDMLIEMKEQKILPDKITMNATLCFFCKAGMMEAALELYESRDEFGLSVNSITYNCLMNTLFADMHIDNAYRVLKNAITQGYFPGKKTLSIIVDALCRENKLDEVKELILAAIDKNFMPSSLIYDKFIKALCTSSRIVDGYEVLGEINRFNANTTRNTYFTLISGFNHAFRGDISARLLVEMQEKGHKPTQKLFRAVIFRLCNIGSEKEGERQFFKLLELQLTRDEPSRNIYNIFIDGAGHARKPHLARHVYLMMIKSGISPNLQSDMLLLRSFLKSCRVTEALKFFNGLSERQETSRKFWHIMIVGLCKIFKLEHSLGIFWKMRVNNLKPSIRCYEELVKLLCACRQYPRTFEIIDDLEIIGRPISSYIGNVLLLHSLFSRDLYYVWHKMNQLNGSTPRGLMLGELIDAFSEPIKGEQDVENLEILIQRCFRMNIHTYNMLLRKIMMSDINHGCEYFNQLYEKGYEPNRWSYDILLHGLLKHGRSAEARLLAEELFSKGFDLTEATRNLL